MNLGKYIEKIESELKRWGLPSVAVGIVKGEEVILSDGFGYASTKDKRKPDGDTLYQIGSCSKAFTATALAILSDQGKLDFDKPAREYLPWLRFKDPYLTEHVTVRDLLCHRTGLPRYDAYWVGNDCTRREMVETIKNMEAAFPFRSAWNYQNFCYIAAGMIVEAVSGQSWERFVQEQIFDKLDMKRTMVYLAPYDADDNRSRPYAPEDEDTLSGCMEVDNLRFPCENMAEGVGAPYAPAGGIISCANDMLKWVQFNLNKGKWGDNQIVSERTMHELHRTNMIMDQPPLGNFPERDFCGYGMGWFVESYRGHKLVHHGGNVNGYASHMFIAPELGIGGVVLANFNPTRMTWAFMYDAMDEFLCGENRNWFERLYELTQKQISAGKEYFTKIEQDRVPNTVPSHPLESYAGRYVTNAYKDIRIHEENGNLFLRYNLLKDAKMEHYHYDTFRINEPGHEFNHLMIHFRTGANGKIDSIAVPMEPSLKDEVFARSADMEA